MAADISQRFAAPFAGLRTSVEQVQRMPV